MAVMWMIRSNGGILLPIWFEKGIVAIGWCSDQSFDRLKREDIKRLLTKKYSQNMKSVPIWTSICDNFVNKIKKDDYVLTYDSTSRIYYLGQVIGDYRYDNKFDDPHIRNVRWLSKTVSRDLISNDTKNSLGASQTIFRITTEQCNEILNLFEGNNVKIKDEAEIIEDNIQFSNNLIENAKENLKDSINNLSPDDMEDLVKEILNAMGYIAERTKKGADRGVDVFASKDGLGLEDPRIFAEVKHRKGQMNSQDIRTFTGGRNVNDKCLYISTGGFTKDARYEAERSNIPLKLVDIDDLANLLSLHYDNFSAEGKSLLPLKKVYVPINK